MELCIGLQIRTTGAGKASQQVKLLLRKPGSLSSAPEPTHTTQTCVSRLWCTQRTDHTSVGQLESKEKAYSHSMSIFYGKLFNTHVLVLESLNKECTALWVCVEPDTESCHTGAEEGCGNSHHFRITYTIRSSVPCDLSSQKQQQKKPLGIWEEKQCHSKEKSDP